MSEKKVSLKELVEKKKEQQEQSYYSKHQKNQKGKPYRGKEVNLGRNGSNR